MEDVNDVNNPEQENDTSHDDATVILPPREEKPAEEPAVEPEPEPVIEPEPEPEPVVEEKPVEPISMSSQPKVEEPIQMDSPPPITPEIVGVEQGGGKKKWIIIAVVAVILLCCCCLVAAVALSWEDIADAVEDMIFQVGPALARLQTLTA